MEQQGQFRDFFAKAKKEVDGLWNKNENNEVEEDQRPSAVAGNGLSILFIREKKR